MVKHLIFGAVLAGLMFSCNAETSSQDAESAAEAQEEAQEVKMESFGEEITAEGALSYEELKKQVERSESDSVAMKFTGTVQEVCQVKGCWMTIASSENEESPIMVRFKDYGFFMPKDIAGRQVIMEGHAFKETTPVEELRHYAEDAGKPQEAIEAITEPKEEVKFLASGVLLLEE
jgi:hypothetical protein